MHRVIKFRLWDKEHEAWEDAQYMAIALDGTIMLGAHHSVEPERYVIQQFTGLLDKNGAEIYEGDIVKTDGNLTPLPVIFEDGAFLIAGLGYYLNKVRVSEWFIEVIGNRYEHPELLNAD